MTDASTSGQKASISKHDRNAHVRRASVVQALFMQGALAALLLVLAIVNWRNPKALLLFGVTLVIPLGWGWTFWQAYTRDAAARSEGRWTKETDQTERKRTFGRIAAIFVAWLLLAALILLLL